MLSETLKSAAKLHGSQRRRKGGNSHKRSLLFAFSSLRLFQFFAAVNSELCIQRLRPPGEKASSDIEEDRFLRSLQDDVPAQLSASIPLLGDKRAPPRRIHKTHHVIFRVRCFIRKVHPRHQPAQQSARKNRHRHVRRLRPAVRSGNSARLNRHKMEAAVLVCRHASISEKCHLQFFLLSVFRMAVSSVRVRLPDFNERIRHAFPFPVRHAPFDFDPLPRNSGCREILSHQMIQSEAKERPDRLRRCRSKRAHFPLPLTEPSNGVASRPASTRSNRKPSARSGMVVAQSNFEIKRFRAASSPVQLKIGSNGISGSPGKYIWVTNRVAKAGPKTEK